MTLLLALLGILPSVIWLSVYLREDDHPEPNRLILGMFFAGGLSAFVAAGVEFVLLRGLEQIPLSPIALNLIAFFVVVGFVEEFLKFYAVKVGSRSSRNFDEPTDAMIYLVVAALGFAAVENVFALFSFGTATSVAIEIALLRFVSATLLHVLASAVVGYYFARQRFFLWKNQVIKGLLIATILHGLYNILTLSSNGFERLSLTLLIVALLGIMAIVVNIFFYRLKKDYFQ
jgi:RsiW-degrading membrane proteinase PrsW (M82 family)